MPSIGESAAAVKPARSPKSRLVSFPRRLLLFALLVFGGFSAAYLYGTATGWREVSPVLVVDPSDLDFGEVNASNSFRWKLPIRNDSNRAASIREITTSCNCTSIRPTSALIGPGQAATIELVLDLTRDKGTQTSEEPRPFAVELTAEIAGEVPTRRVWRIQGRVRDPIRLSPSLINFGRIPRLSDAPNKHVRVLSDQPIGELSIHHHGSLVVGMPERIDAYSYGLDLQVGDTSRCGLLDLDLVAKATVNDGETPSSATLRVVGQIVEDVAAIPSVVLLRPDNSSKVVESAVTLRSHAGREFTIIRVQPPDEAISVHSRTGMTSFASEHLVHVTMPPQITRGYSKPLLKPIIITVQERGEDAHIGTVAVRLIMAASKGQRGLTGVGSSN